MAGAPPSADVGPRRHERLMNLTCRMLKGQMHVRVVHRCVSEKVGSVKRCGSGHGQGKQTYGGNDRRDDLVEIEGHSKGLPILSLLQYVWNKAAEGGQRNT